MLNLFLPNQHVKSIFDIKPAELTEKGIKGIITDLDNTLVAWNQPEATPEITEWFNQMKEHHIKVTIVSNNNQERVQFFCEPLSAPFIFRARKPLRRAFRKATKKMGLKNDEVVVIGDQLMTDIFGGNVAGLYTILVVPILQTDGKLTRLNRKIERYILRQLRKKGKITWEE
ncbi:YqeG family HAD IIIA-type phosphatase [Virgibacillus sp. 179-BFC.A HS]|uniref:YqeG family HAD IIIA-type phosphatase n=1 Tax=Tigheibacillus jepli TaxID=3035914 RepID=A0ABU5CGP9_9BACI|nr:YqeG family HAD IIIA-type phosphatase [Virgibacillus sp. 179-BFC.A HS]MDY0405508.1 YqeG family HAD IIIA-type phosphatase [Virgibacillus sp. 179-BFC.A HS]